MYELKSKTEEILEKYRREGRVTTLSLEKSCEISDRIKSEMREVRRDYERRKEQSWIDAGKCYINC